MRAAEPETVDQAPAAQAADEDQHQSAHDEYHYGGVYQEHQVCKGPQQRRVHALRRRKSEPAADSRPVCVIAGAEALREQAFLRTDLETLDIQQECRRAQQGGR